MESRLLLSVSMFLLMMTASPLARAQDSAGADAREVKAYRLTMDKITKLNAATKSLRKLAMTDPAVCAVMAPAEGDEGKSLTDRAKRIEAAYPKVVPLLKPEGLTVRAVLLLQAVRTQAEIVVAAKSLGVKKLPMQVNPENVTFMEQHNKELDAMQADLEKDPDPCMLLERMEELLGDEQ